MSIFGATGNLTPGQRAFLKACQGALYTMVVAALPAVAQAILMLAAPGTHAFQWSPSLTAILIGGAVSALMALHKYLSAQRDQPLAQVSAAVVANVATQIQAAIPPVPPVPPLPSDPNPTLTPPAPPAVPASAGVAG